MAEESLGRNAPCWCGGGKKYKECHLDADRKAEADHNGRHAPRARDILEIRESILALRQIRSDEVGPDRP